MKFNYGDRLPRPTRIIGSQMPQVSRHFVAQRPSLGSTNISQNAFDDIGGAAVDSPEDGDPAGLMECEPAQRFR